MFANVVTTENGQPIAGFISSIDARQYANKEAAKYGTLLVNDYAGGVTEHRPNGSWAVVATGAEGGSIDRFLKEGGKGKALLF